MRFQFLPLLMLLSLASASARGEDIAPVEIPAPMLTCPQCGTWSLEWGSGGTSGEAVEIAPGRVVLPGRGEYCASVIKQRVETREYGDRHYLTTIALSPTCNAASADTLLMQIDVSTGFSKDGSLADMKLFYPSSSREIYAARGWNDVRESPCDAGAGGPSTRCWARISALSYKRLALTVLEIQRSLPPQEAGAFVRRFNPASFAIALVKFCDRREATRGSGSWPSAWSLNCQDERMNRKIVELEDWNTCRSTAGARCKAPNAGFDKSKDPYAD